MTSFYTDQIKAATGCDDATAALVEKVISWGPAGLDHLTAAELEREAREMLAELRADPSATRFFAEVNRLAVPTWTA